VENADQVDDRILTAHQFDECLRIVHVGLDHADRRQHDQLLGVVAVAGGIVTRTPRSERQLAIQPPTKPLPPINSTFLSSIASYR
jgi:hypothetical protein